MTDLEQRMLEAIKIGVANGIQPRAIYLKAADFDELGRDEIDGIPVRRSQGEGPSRVYFQSGRAHQVRKAQQ